MNQILKNKFSSFFEIVEEWISKGKTGQLRLKINFNQGGIRNWFKETEEEGD